MRCLLPLFFGACGLGCATTSAPPDSKAPAATSLQVSYGEKTHNAPTAGGDGGTPYRQLCPDSWVVTGLRGANGLYVDRVGVICSPLQLRRAEKKSGTGLSAACQRGDAKACMDAGDAAETDRQRARFYRAAALAYREASVATPRRRPATKPRPSNPVRSHRPLDYATIVTKIDDFTYALDWDGLDQVLTDLTQLS